MKKLKKQKTKKIKLYKGEYEFYIIDKDDYVVDVFYNIDEFREAYSHLNTKGSPSNTSQILSRIFNGHRKYFISKGERYTIEFQKPEEELE